MARGHRTNLATLAGAVGDNSPVDQVGGMPSRTAPLSELTANPRNPRDDLGDLTDLASIADTQLQPALVVTKDAYLRLYPDDDITRPLRRRQRVPAPGRRPQLRPHRPRDRRQRRDRPRPRDADRRVDRRERRPARLRRHRRGQGRRSSSSPKCGRADEAANPAPQDQGLDLPTARPAQAGARTADRAARGELAIRDRPPWPGCRSSSRSPGGGPRWTKESDAAGEGSDGADKKRPPTRSRVIADAMDEFRSKPEALADALHAYLGADGVQTCWPSSPSAPRPPPPDQRSPHRSARSPRCPGVMNCASASR